MNLESSAVVSLACLMVAVIITSLNWLQPATFTLHLDTALYGAGILSGLIVLISSARAS